MAQKPKILIFLAFLHLLAPFGNVFINSVFVGASWEYMFNLLNPSYLTVNWPIVVCPILAAFAIYSCKKWSFYVYLGSVSILFVLTVLGYLSKSETLGIGPLVFIFVVNILVVGYFLVPAVREVYFNPKLRWWEREDRFVFETPCVFGDQASGVVTNISNTGLFLKTDNISPKNSIDIQFTFESKEYSLRGEVVYRDFESRLGVGVRFRHDRESKLMTKQLIQRLRELDRKIPIAMAVEESFFLWLRNLIQRGEGLFPKKVALKTSVESQLSDK